MIWIAGIKGLFSSRKGMLCLIILAVSAYIAIKGMMSPSFAAVVSTLAAIYQYTQHKTDIATMGRNPGSLMGGP